MVHSVIIRRAIPLACLSALLHVHPAAFAQTTLFGSGAGGAVLLTNNGFGLGGYVRRSVGARSTILIEVSLGAGKDERELRFQQLGSSIVPYKRNYFLMVPVHAGYERRVFAERIVENFRPYVQVGVGPTVGWEYPYFDDRNGNDVYDEDVDRRWGVFAALPRGSLHVGIGGSIAVGAWFGTGSKVTQGVRFGYSAQHFFRGVQLLEPDIRRSQTVFHSPVITIVFGRLF